MGLGINNQIQVWVSALALIMSTLWLVNHLQKTQNRWLVKFTDWLPPILFAYLIPAFGRLIIPIESIIPSLSWFSKSFLIPAAVFSVMAGLNIRSLKSVWPKPIMLFLSGSFIIASLPILILGVAKLFFLEVYLDWQSTDLWKGLVPIVGSWIGGSTSQVVLKEIIDTPDPLFLSVLLIDNIAVNLWTILMFQWIKKSDHIDNKWGIQKEKNTELNAEEKKGGWWSTELLVIIGYSIMSYWLPWSFLTMILCTSVLGVIISVLAPKWNTANSLRWAGWLIILVMVFLGFKLDFSQWNIPISLISVVLVWFVFHALWIGLHTYIFRVPSAWLAITSMANLGGISTAPAVTAAYDQKLMPHAVLLSILSMATGTLWGLWTIYWIQQLFVTL